MSVLFPLVLTKLSAVTAELKLARNWEYKPFSAIVRDMTKDEAIIAMVDSNLQREHLLPSEKAFAYKMELEAMKHQDKNYGQVVHKSRYNISDNESGRQVQKYIRLTYLIPELINSLTKNG